MTFDATKEGTHVLSQIASCGPSFTYLGIQFDFQLLMHDDVHTWVTDTAWRTRALLRARRFFNDAERVFQYKQQVLSYIEYRSAAAYHATSIALTG